jgi:serpin B
MNRKILYTFALLGILLPASQGHLIAAPDDHRGGSLGRVVAGQNELAFDLYEQMAPTEGNIFFSPTSIHLALAMTYGGATGLTADEMAQALHFPEEVKTLHLGNHRLQHLFPTDPDLPTHLNMANSLWPGLDFTIKESFLNLCQSNYGSELQALDFSRVEEARETINHWVDGQTNQMIPELLRHGDLSPDVVLVLANAIHFKGTWRYRFDENRTRPRPFHLADGTTVDVPTMHLQADLRFHEDGRTRIIQLPYAESSLALTLISPGWGRSLTDLEATLTLDRLQEWLGKLRQARATLLLPRFTLEQRQDLRKPLQALGMERAFLPGAQFNLLSEEPVFISKVIHQAKVSLDEEGTEAAAATAVVMKRESSGPFFSVDSPFLFLIQDTETGAILFMGRVSDPTL